MSLSEFDRQNIGEIVAGHGDWFSAYLLRLCAKADQRPAVEKDLL